MAARGRKPNKRVLMSVNPNPRPSTTNKNPIVFDVDSPLLPSWLDAVAKKKYIEIVKNLKPMAVLSPLDGDLLSAYCAIYSQMIRCQERINKNGGFLAEKGRPIKTDPAVDQMVNISAKLANLGKLFGLSPLARTKISGDPVKQERNWLDGLCAADETKDIENS